MGTVGASTNSRTPRAGRSPAPVIGVVCLGAPAGLGTRLCESVARAWPGRDAGPLFRLDASEPGEALSRIAGYIQGVDGLLLIAGAAISPQTVARVATALGDSLVPGLVLFEEGADAGVAQRSGAMAALPLESQPGLIAGAMFALLSRQPALEQLQRDLEGEGHMRCAAAKQIEQMQSEANMAVLVQRELLPKSLPTVAGLDLGVLFRPGTDLSGDLYDVERLDEHHVGFLIADAAGHGAPAALMTVLINRLLPTKDVCGREYRIVPPWEALTRLNEAFMRRRGDLVAIVSAVYGVIDARTGVVQIANAGHPRPLVVSPRGSTEVLESGPLLGMAEGITYGQATVRLALDETLVLYSDGFEHAFHEGEAARCTAGNSLHLSAFAALGRRDSGDLGGTLAAMTSRLDEQRGSLHQVDDITLLAIGRGARAQAAAA